MPKEIEDGASRFFIYLINDFVYFRDLQPLNASNPNQNK